MHLESPGRHWRWISRATYVVSLAACAWILFWPEPYALAIGIGVAAPWIGAGLVTWSDRRLVLIDANKDDDRPALSGLLLAGLMVAGRASRDIHFYHWLDPLWPTLAAAPLVFVLLWRLDRSIAESRARQFFLVLFALGIGWSYVALVDRFADRSEPKTFRPLVLSSQVERGRYTSYRLQLADWGDRPHGDWLNVRRSTYQALAPGSTACVRLHDGALRIPWFELGPCT